MVIHRPRRRMAQIDGTIAKDSRHLQAMMSIVPDSDLGSRGPTTANYTRFECAKEAAQKPLR
jgi:hypothetical protein